MSLRDRLDALHDELGSTESVDTATRERLILLLGDITRLLERSGRSEPHDASILARLEALAVSFEAEHPSLGGAVRQLVDALAKAGI